jgi:hypothetical protein
MGSTMEEIMRKRRQEAQDAYEAQWQDGRGSHHPDFDPLALGPAAVKASRATEELYGAIVANDVSRVYDKIEEGADVDFVFGEAYSCPEGYTPLMVACHRGRWGGGRRLAAAARTHWLPAAGCRSEQLWVGAAPGRIHPALTALTALLARRYECARALLRAGADPNFVNSAGDHTLFWAIDGRWAAAARAECAAPSSAGLPVEAGAWLAFCLARQAALAQHTRNSPRPPAGNCLLNPHHAPSMALMSQRRPSPAPAAR